MTPDIITYPDAELMALSLADRIAAELRQHIDTDGRASLCLSGGSTPAPLYHALSDLPLDWSRVTVFLNDERWVDGDHPRSNAALIRRTLLQGKAAQARYIDLFTGDPAPGDAAPALSEAIAAQLPITVLLLGMGDDMHTASLFPGAEGLAACMAQDAPAVMAAQGGEEPRITLTAPALHSAIYTHLMIRGDEKRAALDRAVALADPLQAPIYPFLSDAKVHHAP